MRIEQLRTRLCAAVVQWYMPREVLIRSDGRVRYVVLSRRRQLAATAGVGAIAAVTLTLAIGWAVADYRLDRRDEEVATAKAAYIELLAEVSQYSDEFAALSRDMEANEAALLGLIKGRTPELDVVALEERLARSQLEREQQLAGSATLKRKLELFATDLRSVVSRNEQLAANIALLQDQLDAAEAEKRKSLELRAELELELAAAEVQLAESDARNAALDGTIGELEGSLSDALEASEAERATSGALRRELAAMEIQLAELSGHRTLAERRLTETQRRLEALRNQREALLLARSQLGTEVGRLQSRIAAIEASQASVVRQLAERTRSGADEVEKTVAMTGVDVDSLLLKVTTELSGLGGPFVPAGDRAVRGEVRVLPASVAPLDLEMSRLEKLHLALRSLPLSAPLDHYTVGSTFGMRKDPINGKLAVHEGLDFSSPMGSSVLATAPGTVIFAGRKGSYGRLVEIDHGFGIVTRYAHLQSILVEVGQSVEYRDKIGKLGSSGRSTGPHVHYEILVDGKPYDPMNFLKAGRYVFKV